LPKRRKEVGMKVIKEGNIEKLMRKWKRKITCKCKTILEISFKDLFLSEVSSPIETWGPNYRVFIRCPSCKEKKEIKKIPADLLGKVQPKPQK
jgi:hypothetical protein